MGFLSTLLEFIGFGIGIPVGILVGFYLFVYSKPKEVQDPVSRALRELDTDALSTLLPELPLWVKNPDYERVYWLNKFIVDMWPYLDKAICNTIRNMAQPIFAEYIGNYPVDTIEFQKLTLGSIPPVVQGVKVYETNERDLVIEPAIRWAGNPDIILVLKSFYFHITFQFVDLQISITPRVALKPLVSTLPCFGNIVVSLMERPHVDFGLHVLGGDVMSIPGLYHIVQSTIEKQIACLYIWPRTLIIPVLDPSEEEKKPVGILHVKVVRALKLLKMDIIGASDPYVKLSLTHDQKLAAKKTTIKRKTLNPEWNEKFKFIVKDPELQVLILDLYDWDKVGTHDRLGLQFVPLNLLKPYETKEFALDLLNSENINDTHDTKQRGKIVVELTFIPFKEDSAKFAETLDGYERINSGTGNVSSNAALDGAGLLSVIVQGAEDVEGEHHNNPYALILFRGEKRKTKVIKRTRDPIWNEEFEFMLEEPPLNEKIHIEVMSKPRRFSLKSRESLGQLDINLTDVVYNGRINNKYHLINSKNGMIHVEIGWKTV